MFEVPPERLSTFHFGLFVRILELHPETDFCDLRSIYLEYSNY